MSTRLVTAVMFVAAASLVMGCRPATDLNTPCRLVAGNPDGGAPRQLLEKEVRAKQTANKDFISLGTVECEDFICVRDTSFQSDAGDDDPAFGYCSRACAQGSSCPSQDSSLDDGPNRLRCRALLLDAETLKELSDKGLNPGNVRDPYFCARGQPDGGA
jgi:hypothetical protein